MKKEYFFDLINTKCPGATPLFLVVVGSQAYGTSLPTSDFDYSGVYIQSQEDIFGFGYKPQLEEKKEKGESDSKKDDTVFYEIKRFIELLQTNNPTVLQLLYSPEDCIIYKHPLFDMILNQKDSFITKKCKDSFGGYARQQISKAKGQNKMQGWEKNRVTRKDILDFCYVIDGVKSYRLKPYLKGQGWDLKLVGLSKVPHARDLYAAFYDFEAHKCFGAKLSEEHKEANKKKKKRKGEAFGIGYKGITKEDSKSNSVRLSSIPKNEEPMFNMYFNKDGYTCHCVDYKRYHKWLKERNVQRWVDVKGHGQKIDGKNMLHCKRLLEMSREIAEGRGVIIRRPNAADLIKIRKGEVSLETLIEWAEKEIKNVDKLFNESNLAKEVDIKKTNKLLIDIRKQFYKDSLTLA